MRVIEDFLSEEKTQQLRNVQVEVISKRYANYKGAKKGWNELTSASRIHLISSAAGKLFLYDKDSHIKYVLSSFKST